MARPREGKDLRKQVSFSLNPDLAERLKTFSEITGVPMSRIVEKSVEMFLEKHNPRSIWELEEPTQE